jgi:hypothetical protein
MLCYATLRCAALRCAALCYAMHLLAGADRALLPRVPRDGTGEGRGARQCGDGLPAMTSARSGGGGVRDRVARRACWLPMRGEVRLSVSASAWMARPRVSHWRLVSASCSPTSLPRRRRCRAGGGAAEEEVRAMLCSARRRSRGGGGAAQEEVRARSGGECGVRCGGGGACSLRRRVRCAGWRRRCVHAQEVWPPERPPECAGWRMKRWRGNTSGVRGACARVRAH